MDSNTFPAYSPESFARLSSLWTKSAWQEKHHYSFSWLGVPIIQLPHDMLRLQECITRLKPDVIIETGVARAGSLIFWASIQQLCGIDGKVLGIDIDIRDHARQAIDGSHQKNQIQLLQGSSTDLEIFSKNSFGE